MQRKLASILRVDHAGEVAADAIYRGQHLVLSKQPVGPLIKEMWDQEKRHLESFETILKENRVRPSALRGLWEALGFGLGVSTALLGKEAAMACTEAVETVIGNHYNDQLRQMIQMDKEASVEQLQEIIKEFRDDELDHLKIALENDAKKASNYPLLTGIIQTGCKVAIEIAKRI